MELVGSLELEVELLKTVGGLVGQILEVELAELGLGQNFHLL